MNTNELFIDANKLPQPLPKSQVNELLDKVKHGDEDAIKMIIEHNIRLVLYQVNNRFKSVAYDKKDLVSIGNIGLIKAVTTFDKSKSVEFATYATRCIDNEILMFLRKNKKRKSEISFEDSLSYDSEGNELHLEDILGTDEDIVTSGLERETEKNLLLGEINRLKGRDREIMIMRYGLFGADAMTQKDVALTLGISQSYISRIEKKIILRLKNNIRV